MMRDLVDRLQVRNGHLPVVAECRLPIFRTRDNSSPSVAHDRDLHCRTNPDGDGRRRMWADETKDETTEPGRPAPELSSMAPGLQGSTVGQRLQPCISD